MIRPKAFGHISDRIADSLSFVRSVSNAIQEIVVPSLCIECRKTASNGWCCEKCLKRIRFTQSDWCPVCALPSDQNHSPDCPQGSYPTKSLRKSNISRIPWLESRTLGAYHEGLRLACLSGKNSAGTWATKHLVQMWWDYHQSWAEQIGPCLIVPIPRHWSRQWISGNDPADSIAHLLGQHWASSGGQYCHALYRKKPTPRLSGLKTDDRQKMMTEIFGLSRKWESQIRNKTSAVIVDDIYTTGATARSAALALLAAGSERIFFASLARTLENNI